tara:strand:- start:2578 stop:3489 length:912 start_codon:yes stop_codon:yes gene_type:complete
MSSKRILIMGADGMLGKMVSLYFGSLNEYSIVLTSRSESDFLKKNFNNTVERYDVLDDNFEDFAKKINPHVVINCIGRIKPTIDEANPISVSETININSFFPMEIQKFSVINNSSYYQIGTDCVYSGKDGNYNEGDYLDAEDLYGKSKIAGEIPGKNKHIIRSSIIGPEHGAGRSLLNWFLKNESKEVFGFKNHLWNGVTTLNFAKVIHGLILNQSYSTGLQHLITSDKVTKADLLRFFKIYFDKEIKINEVNAENIIDRTLNTINNKNNEQLWLDAGYNKVPSVEENIAELSESEFTKMIIK